MPLDAPTARASSLDFATLVAKRPRRPGASMRQRRMDIYQVPLRGPGLISHGLYVWLLLPVLRGTLPVLLLIYSVAYSSFYKIAYLRRDEFRLVISDWIFIA